MSHVHAWGGMVDEKVICFSQKNTLIFATWVYAPMLAWTTYHYARKEYLAFKYQSTVVGSRLDKVMRVEAAQQNLDFEEYRERTTRKYRTFKFFKIVYAVLSLYCAVCPFALFLGNPARSSEDLERNCVFSLSIFTAFSGWYSLYFRDVRFAIGPLPLPEGVAYA